ncbi:MAG: radical SAM protein [Halobacteriota archaeon]|nr:radical SAM protein [Halobacteriota archaeon]
MKAVLLYPENFIKVLKAPPYSLLAPAKAILDAGHDVTLLDARFDDDLKKLDSELSDADLLCVSAMTDSQYATSIEAMRAASEYGCKIALIGVFSTFNREILLNSYIMDFIVSGDASKTLAECMTKDYRKVPGTSYIAYGEHVDNPLTDTSGDHGLLPLPWHLIKPERYVEDYKGMKIYRYATSGGCPNRCAYCYQKNFWKCGWVGPSQDKVLEDIDLLTEKVNLDAIYFFDDNIMAERERAFDIFDGLYNRDIMWSCMTRADNLDRDFVEKMSHTGCYKICVYSESGSQKTLDSMKADFDVVDSARAAMLLGVYGIKSEFYFMIGYLGETMDDVSETIELKEHVERICDADTIIKVTFPLFGTEYYNQAYDAGFRRKSDIVTMCAEDQPSSFPKLPWFTPEDNRKIRYISLLSELVYLHKTSSSKLPMLQQLILHSLAPALEYHMKHKMWDHPIEIGPLQRLTEFNHKKVMEGLLTEVVKIR